MKTKWISIAVVTVFILLGISLAVPRFQDKERVSGYTAPTVSVVSTGLINPSTVKSSDIGEEKTGEEGQTISAAATTADSALKQKATETRSQTTAQSTEKIETSTVAGQAEWQAAQYYVERLGRVLTIPESVAVLRYTYNDAEDFYYTNFTVPAGTLFYTYKNTMAPLTARYSDSLDVRFDYGGKAWLVRLVKGQYAWIFVGGEAEVFCSKKASTKELGGSNAFYGIPAAAECPDISVDLEWSRGQDTPVSFSRTAEQSWLCDGYVFGILENPVSPLNELQMAAKIVFPEAEMASLFAAGLEELGFSSVRSSVELPEDSFYRKEKIVWVNWQSAFGGVTVENGENNSN